MNKLKQSFIEVITAVLPVAAIMLILNFTIAPFGTELMIKFLVGSVMMILGMTLFLFGAEFSMMEVGHQIGSFIVRHRNIAIFVIITFMLGLIVTIAEPNLQILAEQVAGATGGKVPKLVLLLAVGVGVGFMLVVAAVRIFLKVDLIYIFLCGFLIVFLFAIFFTPADFMPVSFDAGGVTTGPIMVPLVLAFASGITSVMQSKKSGDDTFGMVGLTALGPIIAVLILGGIYK